MFSAPMARRVGVSSMIATILFGWLASMLHDRAPDTVIVKIVVVLAAACFAIWLVCGFRLWIMMWRWLFRSWDTREVFGNLGWGMLIMAGSIVLPFFISRRLTSAQ
jgi:hypothetical protein